MPTITNTIIIERTIHAVFDVATTIKYWPIWHPQCENVKGATENPIQLNEKASEKVKLGIAKKIVTWTCSIHERPHKLRLDGTTSGIRSYIEYKFKEREEGQCTTDILTLIKRFRRWTLSSGTFYGVGLREDIHKKERSGF